RRAISARSSAPSSPRMSGPNSSTSFASPGVPGSTARRARSSASRITAPCSARRSATVLLPAPTPPVSATRSIGRGASARAALAALEVLEDGLQRHVLVRSALACATVGGSGLLRGGGGLGRRGGRLGRGLFGCVGNGVHHFLRHLDAADGRLDDLGFDL